MRRRKSCSKLNKQKSQISARHAASNSTQPFRSLAAAGWLTASMLRTDHERDELTTTHSLFSRLPSRPPPKQPACAAGSTPINGRKGRWGKREPNAAMFVFRTAPLSYTLDAGTGVWVRWWWTTDDERGEACCCCVLLMLIFRLLSHRKENLEHT